jgi:hypothetical protein
LKEKCNNIIIFGVTSKGFSDIAEYIAGSIILDNRLQHIIQNNAKAEATSWQGKIQQLLTKLTTDPEDIIY